tara:strand:+ start:335 stop:835 length:501 start_codon:yes stop_codon:yes gene_type:complete
MCYNIIRFILFLVLLTSTGCSCGYGLGDVACDFELTDQHGQQRSLSDYHGDIVILDLTISWCVTCREAFRGQSNLLNKLGDQDITWLTIIFQNKTGSEVTVEDCAAVARQNNIVDPVLVGDHDIINDAYLVTGWPSYYIINKDMVITDHIAGWYEDEITHSVLENK